mgnify:CR=1 FL=1
MICQSSSGFYLARLHRRQGNVSEELGGGLEEEEDGGDEGGDGTSGGSLKGRGEGRSLPKSSSPEQNVLMNDK